eukprot:7568245-Ditylum_brightwellii.AAC.1
MGWGRSHQGQTNWFCFALWWLSRELDPLCGLGGGGQARPLDGGKASGLRRQDSGSSVVWQCGRCYGEDSGGGGYGDQLLC